MTARPELGVLVAECIAQWAQVECSLGVTLAVKIDPLDERCTDDRMAWSIVRDLIKLFIKEEERSI